MGPILLVILLAALILRGVDAFCPHLTAQGRWLVLLVIILLLVLFGVLVPESRGFLAVR